MIIKSKSVLQKYSHKSRASSPKSKYTPHISSSWLLSFSTKVFYSLTTKEDFPGPKYQQINPANGEKSSQIPTDTEKSISLKFSRAKEAQKKWIQVPLENRMEIFQTYAEKLSRNSEELAASLSTESGKPITQAINEIKATIPRIKYFIHEVANVLEPRIGRETETRKEMVTWEPLGVVANISAWNYPFFVGSNVYVPGLLTGNAVLYKPSEYVAKTCYRMVELAWEAGVPKDVFIPILGERNVGQTLLNQPIDGVFFTGSNRAGKEISRQVADRFIRIQLELGGKDPAYIADDVDLKSVVPAVADGAFYNTGQSCCSVERIYVHQSVYDEFVDLCVKEVKSYKVGMPSDPTTYIGPLTLPTQPKLLKEHVDDAVAKGAKILVGGNIIQKPGNWFEPTLVVNINHKMRKQIEKNKDHQKFLTFFFTSS